MSTEEVTTISTQEPGRTPAQAAKADPDSTAIREAATSRVTPEPAPVQQSTPAKRLPASLNCALIRASRR